MFVAYREVFNDAELNRDCNLIYTPYFDLELYKRTNYGERLRKCYIIRKVSLRSDLPKEFDGIVIDNLPEKEKVEVFNNCEYCISYDTQIACSGIAEMCGCISVIVPEGQKNRENYISKENEGYGRAYDFSDKEIDYAVNTKDTVIDYYKSINESSQKSVESFIKFCKEYFD